MRSGLALALSWIALAAGPALAQSPAAYPQRPIKVLVPVAAGGVTDIVARQWAERIKGPLGSTYIENRGGGSGVIAALETARSAPDGYTLFVANSSVMAVIPLTMATPRYNPATDFAHIAILCVSPTSVAVTKSLPARTLQELIAYARANPGKLSIGSAGTGTTTHLVGELLKQKTAMPDIVHVPYKGAGPGIADLISGHIPMMTPNITGQIIELHKAGTIRILAVNMASRLTVLPEIPTAIEAGVPGLIGSLAITVSAPAGTPRPILDRILAASRSAMADPEFLRQLRDAGLEPVLEPSPEHAAAFLAEEHERWQPIVKSIGLRTE